MTENGETLRQDVTSILKKTRLGPLGQKDTWDLFSSLVLSMGVSTHKKMFTSYHNTFTGLEACQNFNSLKLIRSPDIRNIAEPVPLSIYTTSTPEKTVLTLLQHFIDACLIKDATTDKETSLFEKRGIYNITPKGLRTIEEFVQECRLESEADHLVALLSTQPTPRPWLVHLTRHTTDDELVITQATISHLFRKFVGRWPRYTYQKRREDVPGVLFIPKYESSRLLESLFKKDDRPLGGKILSPRDTVCVYANKIVNWLCNHTTVTSSSEAGEVAAQFVRFGLLVLASTESNKMTKIEVSGTVPRGNTHVVSSAEFLYTHRVIYAVTIEGSSVARWIGGLDVTSGVVHSQLNSQNNNNPELPRDEPLNPANAARLKNFLRNSTIRGLFRQFLSEEHCQNDLAFWIDIEDFRAEFEAAHMLTSTATVPDLPPVEGSSNMPVDSPPQPERPHDVLANRPFLIFNTYLAPSGKYQLSFNVGKDLLEEMKSSLEQCVEHLTNQILITEPGDPFADPATLDIDQLSIIVWLYECIQNRVFCVMADEYVPKFLRWPTFLASRIEEIAPAAEVPEPDAIDKGKNKEHAD